VFYTVNFNTKYQASDTEIQVQCTIKPSKTIMTKKEILNRKGIYLLPNLFTTGAMFAGYFERTLVIDKKNKLSYVVYYIVV